MSVYELAQEEDLPCCTLVALALLEGLGTPIDSVDDGVQAGGLDWWKKANVWDAEEPWSALYAARDVTGGTARIRIEIVKDQAPHLKVGRWSVIQRWRRLDDGDDPGPDDDKVVPGQSTGHTYLAHMSSNGECRIVQSSVSKGYRDTMGTWRGNAGLTGYTVGVVTLPEEWTWAGS
tara:strand:+ start:581 stop:1108 length:528 start_codon:yes stop_codon:yes gene_type:complete